MSPWKLHIYLLIIQIVANKPLDHTTDELHFYYSKICTIVLLYPWAIGTTAGTQSTYMLKFLLKNGVLFMYNLCM